MKAIVNGCVHALLIYLIVSENSLVTEAVNQTDGNETIEILWPSSDGVRYIHWKESLDVLLNITCPNGLSGTFLIHVISENTDILRVQMYEEKEITCKDGQGIKGQEDVVALVITVTGQFLGRTNLTVALQEEQSNTSSQFEVVVLNNESALNKVFVAVIAVFVIIINFGFGCKIDLKVVKAILLKPIPPIIGMMCQFIIMPLLGCALSYVMGMEKSLGFGLLVTASAPGGGASNVWTFMLGGDLDLSLTMTFCSKTLAFVMMPFWMFCLGQLYVSNTAITIPYANIVYGLISIIVPCTLGVLLNRYHPNAAKKFCFAIKPMSCLFILWVIIVGSITNTYVYPLMGNLWYVIPAGFLLPFLGMFFGWILARFAQQGNKRAVTIGIETGVQDTGIAILLLLSSFPKPYGDLAATMPITSAIFTPIPLMIALLVVTVRDKCWGAGKGEKPLRLDAEKDEDVLSTTNTKTSELSPMCEKDTCDILPNGATVDNKANGDSLMVNGKNHL